MFLRSTTRLNSWSFFLHYICLFLWTIYTIMTHFLHFHADNTLMSPLTYFLKPDSRNYESWVTTKKEVIQLIRNTCHLPSAHQLVLYYFNGLDQNLYSGSRLSRTHCWTESLYPYLSLPTQAAFLPELILKSSQYLLEYFMAWIPATCILCLYHHQRQFA